MRNEKESFELDVITISPGDKLPCHPDRIIHTKKRGDKVDGSLKIWFVSCGDCDSK